MSEIDQHNIRDALKPIWDEKADTAREAINRIGLVLKHAAALGLGVDVLACEKANALLGKTRNVVTHVPAMPRQDVPAFYDGIGDGTVTHLAIRLLILTGVRSQPFRLLTLNQIDGDTWTIPAKHMKGPKGKT